MNLTLTNPPLATAGLDNDILTIANSEIIRRWKIDTEGRLHPISLYHKATETEWLNPERESFPILPEGRLPDEPRTVTLESTRAQHSPTEEASLRATLTASGAQATVTTTFQIFPTSPAISIQVRSSGTLKEAAGTDLATRLQPTGVELVDKQGVNAITENVLDCLPLAPSHVKLTVVTLLDQTDLNDELVHLEEQLLHPNKNRRNFDGILFAIENTLTGNGLIQVKEAPLPHACPIKGPPALQVRGLTCLFTGHGAGDDSLDGYRQTVIAYSGGHFGRIEALQHWQRQRRGYQSERDGLFLTNTWGDRSQDGRITESFMLKEVESAAKLGADVVQIDDGWQNGISCNSVQSGGVWIGFWEADPDFWKVKTTALPNGLAPLVARAQQHHMKFGLWFAPDSAHEFSNWEKDAEVVLDLYRTHDIRFFKIDGVKALTKRGERNLRAFFDKVLIASQAEITFDLDVTAEIRPGYFGMMNVGPIFVENRYTDWQSYWPHRTLRNLWQLAHWIDPVRLRMEFLNTDRNQEAYANDPLAPANYTADALFATTFFSSPLGWFEASNLSDEFVEQVSNLAAIRNEQRDCFLTGSILPIGQAPDGVAWTGFLSIAADKTSATVLAFRELNNSAHWTLQLPEVIKHLTMNKVRTLAGSGHSSARKGCIEIEIPEKLGYHLVQFELSV